jgi:LDH2 family malate/lactate/ureidoglycolate dehydrogenase
MLSDVADNHRDPGARPDVGQLYILIDAARLMPPSALADRLDRAAGIVSDTRPVPGGPAPRLPGARAIKALDRARAEGFDVAADLLKELEGLAG